MKHKSKNKGKGFTETEREAQLSSQVFVLSELLDMTSTIIEELRTDNDCLVDENNDYSELVRRSFSLPLLIIRFFDKTDMRGVAVIEKKRRKR